MTRRKKRTLLALGGGTLVVLTAVLGCPRGTDPRTAEDRPTVLEGHHLPVQALAFGPGGDTLTSAAYISPAIQTGVEVAVWDVRTGNRVAQHHEYPGALRFLTFAPGGQRLAATVGDREVVLWDVWPWRERARLALPGLFGSTIAFSDDEVQLATTDFLDGITVWDVANSRTRSSCKVQVVSSLAFAPGGVLLACGAKDCTVWLWGPATGEEVGCLRGHERPVYTLSFSPDGRLLASGAYSGAVKLWDVAARELRATLTVSEDRDEIVALAFAPDGRTLAVAVDQVVQLWDVATGCLLTRLEGHAGKVKCLAFSPDGTHLASGGYDQKVWLWDVARYQTRNAHSRQ
jgi:WD40 repeat protein